MKSPRFASLNIPLNKGVADRPGDLPVLYRDQPIEALEKIALRIRAPGNKWLPND
jgi:hypothetical protein